MEDHLPKASLEVLAPHSHRATSLVLALRFLNSNLLTNRAKLKTQEVCLVRRLNSDLVSLIKQLFPAKPPIMVLDLGQIKAKGVFGINKIQPIRTKKISNHKLLKDSAHLLGKVTLAVSSNQTLLAQQAIHSDSIRAQALAKISDGIHKIKNPRKYMRFKASRNIKMLKSPDKLPTPKLLTVLTL